MNFVAKNQTVYEIFESSFEQSPTRVGPARENAHEVKRMADQLAFDMQELKVELTRSVDGLTAKALTPMDWIVGYGSEAVRLETFNVEAGEVEGKDNKDKGGQLMILEGRGAVLKGKLEEFREFLLSICSPESAEYHAIEELLHTNTHTTKTGVVESWEIHNFDHLPMIAVITNLTKLQSDVRNAEAEIINYLLHQIGATDTRVNKMEAIVMTRTNFVLTGSEWTGRVVLAAYDSLSRPEVLLGPFRRNADNTDWEIVGDANVLDYDAQGRAVIRRMGSSVGNYPVQGLLRVSTGEGYRHFPFNTEYQVGAPQAVISPSRMNAMYRGLPNPFSIGVSGAPSESINATVTNGQISRAAGGGWVVTPGPGPESVITVTANIDGQTRQMGQASFRVLRVPDPLPFVSNRTGGRIPRAEFAAAQGVEARLENFLFELRYVVQSFTMVVSTPQGDVPYPATGGPGFTDAQRTAIRNARVGSSVIIRDIVARSPELGSVSMNALVFTID